MRTLKLIRAADITLGVIANHEDPLQPTDFLLDLAISAQHLHTMFIQDPLGIFIRFRVRLPDDSPEQFCAPGRLGPYSSQRSLEAALAETRHVVAGSPEEVRVREEKLGLAVLLPAVVRQGGVAVLLGDRAEDAVFGEQEIEDDLQVEGPVAGVVEDEDRIDLEGFGGIRVVDVGGEWAVALHCGEIDG